MKNLDDHRWEILFDSGVPEIDCLDPCEDFDCVCKLPADRVMERVGGAIEVSLAVDGEITGANRR